MSIEDNNNNDREEEAIKIILVPMKRTPENAAWIDWNREYNKQRRKELGFGEGEASESFF